MPELVRKGDVVFGIVDAVGVLDGGVDGPGEFEGGYTWIGEGGARGKDR